MKKLTFSSQLLLDSYHYFSSSTITQWYKLHIKDKLADDYLLVSQKKKSQKNQQPNNR